MSDVELMVKISREAYDLYKAGKATLSSGGVRLLDGSMFKMYQTIEKGSQESLAQQGMGLLKELSKGAAANNALLKNIGNRVNIGNALNQKNFESLMKLTKLSWIQVWLEAVNCVATVACFAVVNRQLTDISGRLSQFVDEYRKDKVDEIRILVSNLITANGILKNFNFTDTGITQIAEYLNQAQIRIQNLAADYENNAYGTGKDTFHLLYNLTSAYTSVLKEYGAQYYYHSGDFPPLYDSWIDTLSYVDQDSFKNRLKRSIWILEPTATSEQMADAFNFSINAIHMQVLSLLKYRELIKILPEEAYRNFDEFLKNKMEKGEVEIVDGDEMTENEADMLLQENGYMAA